MCRWACLEDTSINRFLTHCLGCSGGGGRRIKHRRGFAAKAIQACLRHHGTTTGSCLSIARKPVRQVTHSPNCLHLAVADPGRAGTGEPPCRSEAEVLSEAESNPLIKNPSRACLWHPRGKRRPSGTESAGRSIYCVQGCQGVVAQLQVKKERQLRRRMVSNAQRRMPQERGRRKPASTC